jgi:3-isopropylmalate/(R)-2-methylmalate dehydratase small subunit
LGKSLFYNERYTEGYNKNVDFILNKDPWSNSSIIIAGENFGCGSSREHAPWALLDFGIQCIISNSFADIFFNNSVKNGLLLIKLNKNEIEILSELAMKKESFTVDLINQKISVKDNEINFNVDPIIKDRLIHGYDDIEITLKNKQLIVDYENNKNKFHIWKNIVNEK